MAAPLNVNAPLVGEDRTPSRALLGLMPDLSADEAVVETDGTPTKTFRARLQALGYVPSAPLVNADGTPTRPMVYLLQRLA